MDSKWIPAFAGMTRVVRKLSCISVTLGKRCSGKLGESLEVMIGVAELLRDHRQPPKRVADLQLIAHAHPAVQLNQFLNDVPGGSGDLDLHRRDDALSLDGIGR